jgi:hypothetical protein
MFGHGPFINANLAGAKKLFFKVVGLAVEWGLSKDLLSTSFF